MDDEAHVGFVDTHAERDSGDDDVDALHEEVVLRLGSRGSVEACVIGGGLNVVSLKHLGQFLYFFPGETIDDTALAAVLPDELYYLAVGIVVAQFLPYLIIEVGAVKGAFKFHSVGDAEHLLDVGAHFVGSRSREGDDRRTAQRVHGLANVAVFGAEVVPHSEIQWASSTA